MKSRCAEVPLARLLSASLLATVLTACGGEPAATPAVPGSAQQVEARVGDATVYAVALQTSQIPETVAREHGIERREDRVMLRVSARQGEGDGTRSAPVRVQATVTGLNGQTRALELREASANGLVDHVATVEVDLPDTLRFDIRVSTADGASGTLKLTRDFR